MSFRRKEKSGEETDLGLISLEPRAELRVRVIDRATERPLAGATVHMHSPDGEAEERRVRAQKLARHVYAPARERRATDAEGVTRLPLVERWPCTVIATHPDYCPSAPVVVEAGSSNARELELSLDQGATVEVAVIDEEGAGLLGATVRRTPNQSVVDAYRAVSSFERREMRNAGANGIARFARLVPGLHRFKLESEWNVPDELARERATALELAAGETRSATLIVPASGEVRGVLTAASVPLAGAELFLIDERLPDIGLCRSAGKEQSYGDGSGLRRPLALTRAGGRFTLGSVPVGAYVLEVHHPERALASRVPIEVEAPSVELSIDLPATSVRGRCDDPSALDPSGARVHLGLAAERKNLRVAITPAARGGEGKARMQGMRIGSWRVAVFHGIDRTPLDAITVEVTAGKVARAMLSVQ